MKNIISFLMRKVPRKYLQLFSHIILKILSIFYSGTKQECPICKKRYRKFLPYGVISRENALCPSCLSLERHRLMWLYLKKETNFFSEDMKVLHFAPEYCFIKRFENLKNIDYITADIESPLAKVKVDIRDIPFEDNTFDIFFCNHILEHIDDELKALSELHRVLKPGGWGILQVPLNFEREKTYEDDSITTEKEREIHFGQKDHIREYGRDYHERLAKGGFTVSIIDYKNEIEPNDANLYSIMNNDPIYIVKK